MQNLLRPKLFSMVLARPTLVTMRKPHFVQDMAETTNASNGCLAP